MKTIKSTSITDFKDKLDTAQESSFANPINIECIQLEPGDVLWRFVSKKNGRIFSDYWISKETMGDLMRIFRSWDDYSQKTKKGVVRDNLAVLSAWGSQLSWRVKVNMKTTAIAYRGATGSQKHFIQDLQFSNLYGKPVERVSESRLGGFEQIVVPRLKGLSNAEGETMAGVTHFAHL